MICQHCGATLPLIAMFCGECGRSVAARTSVVPPVPLPSSAMPFSASEVLSITPATPPEPDDPPLSAPALLSRPAIPVASHVAEPVLLGAPERASEERLEAATGVDAGRCPRCDGQAEPDDVFCGTCGEALTGDARIIEPIAPAPSAAPAPAPAPAPQFPPHRPLEPDTENTRLVPRGSTGARFVLQFSTGESYTVIGSGLIGRNPRPEPGEAVDHIVTIADPGRSVSKAHLEFGQDNGVFWVSDRHSGNGSIIREPGAEPRYCEPGRRYRVVRGTRIDLGEQFVVVS